MTVVNLSPDRKLYIQAVFDNFSRYVLAWRVSDSISAAGTVAVLALAKKNALEMGELITVLTDPGTENNNQLVERYTLSQNMQRVLARVEVHYSNSMIESLFRMLKNNFLYHQNIRNIEDLERTKGQVLLQSTQPDRPAGGIARSHSSRVLSPSMDDTKRRRIENKASGSCCCKKSHQSRATLRSVSS